MWNSKLLSVISKGAAAERPGSLGRLAATRAVTQSQFFTPAWLANACWQIINNNATAKGAYKYRVLDNSMGSARLLAHATPDMWEVYGLDTDAALVSAAQELLEQSGFEYQVKCGSMADVTNLPAVSVAVINPPFSITLQSPHMTPYEGVTHYGPFGPHTSALSQEYALVQACAVADSVIAIVPAPLADKVRAGLVANTHSLVGDLQLPTDTFKAENVQWVQTRMLVLTTADNRSLPAIEVFNEYAIQSIQITLQTTETLYKRKLKTSIEFGGLQVSEPVITLPVTGSKSVRLYQKRSSIGLRFECGLTQAICLNALLGEHLVSDADHRYPRHIQFNGHGRLNINAHLLAQDPLASIQAHVVQVLEQAFSAEVTIDSQLMNFIKRRSKQEAVALTPFRKFIKKPGSASASITVNGLASPTDWMGPMIRKGEVYELVSGCKTEYALQLPTGPYDVDLSYLKTMATVDIEAGGTFELLHQGRLEHFPELANQAKSKALALGVNKFLWDFQFNDVLELTLGHKGAGLAAEMGLGKSRMALAICLMGGLRNLIVVKSKLVPEMLNEGKKIGLDSNINLITPTNFRGELKKINLVSYETLRKVITHRGQKVMLASQLKHRFHTAVCDEGSLLGNSLSQRSQAVRQLKARKYFALDGVLVDNYPRNLLPLAATIAGEAVPSQPYSIHKEKLEPWQVMGSKHTVRGAQAFADDFVTLEWAVHQFRDGLEEGAKREVPKIKNVPRYRTWSDAFVKRRVRQEPEVAEVISIQEAVYNKPEVIGWDNGHWAHYMKVATEFAAWFTNHQRKQSLDGKALNLVAVLAEIEAVNRAANCPHIRNVESETTWKETYFPLTSKQRWAIEKVKSLKAAGRKPLLFAQSPDVLERLSSELAKAGVKTLLFTGRQSIAQRTAALNEFRANTDSVDVMLASFGAGMDGLNLPQLSDVVLYNGSWSYRTQSQAVARLLRPEQLNTVVVHQAHLAGSIDIYQAQIQRFKKNAMASGIDYQEQDQSEFLHIDHILQQFVSEIETVRREAA